MVKVFLFALLSLSSFAENNSGYNKDAWRYVPHEGNRGQEWANPYRMTGSSGYQSGENPHYMPPGYYRPPANPHLTLSDYYRPPPTRQLTLSDYYRPSTNSGSSNSYSPSYQDYPSPASRAQNGPPYPIDEKTIAIGPSPVPEGALSYDQKNDSDGKQTITYYLHENHKPEAVSRAFATKYPISKPFREPNLNPEKKENLLLLLDNMVPGWLKYPHPITSPQGCEAFAFEKADNQGIWLSLKSEPKKYLVVLKGVKSFICLGDSLAAIVSLIEKKEIKIHKEITLKETKEKNNLVLVKSGELKLYTSAPEGEWDFLGTESGKFTLTTTEGLKIPIKIDPDGKVGAESVAVSSSCSSFSILRQGLDNLAVIDSKTGKILLTTQKIYQLVCIGTSLASVTKQADEIAFAIYVNGIQKKTIPFLGGTHIPPYLAISNEKKESTFRLSYSSGGHATIYDFRSDASDVIPTLDSKPECVGYSFIHKQGSTVNLSFQDKEIAIFENVRQFICKGNYLALISEKPKIEKATEKSADKSPVSLFIFEKGLLLQTIVSQPPLEFFNIAQGPPGFFRVWYQNKESGLYVRTKTLLVSYDGKKKITGMGSPEFPELGVILSWRKFQESRKVVTPVPPFSLSSENWIAKATPALKLNSPDSKPDFKTVQELFDIAEKPSLSDISDEKILSGNCYQPSKSYGSKLYAFKVDGKLGLGIEYAPPIKGQWRQAWEVEFSPLIDESLFSAFKTDSLFFFQFRYLRSDKKQNWIGSRLRVLRSETGLKRFVLENYSPWDEKRGGLSPLEPYVYCIYEGK